MSDTEPSPGFTPRTVRCPACRQPARYAPDNPWRPFCSARCKQVDLGAWASEAYRVPDPTPSGPRTGDPSAQTHTGRDEKIGCDGAFTPRKTEETTLKPII